MKKISLRIANALVTKRTEIGIVTLEISLSIVTSCGFFFLIDLSSKRVERFFFLLALSRC